jgi:hypothetical protein
MAICEYCETAGPGVTYSPRLGVNLCTTHLATTMQAEWALLNPKSTIMGTLFTALDRGIPINTELLNTD